MSPEGPKTLVGATEIYKHKVRVAVLTKKITNKKITEIYKHKLRVAVFVNEYGSVGIDHQVSV